jgi:murein DD-endopeptidase MepM/ murein hydrolase activator NlpD
MRRAFWSAKGRGAWGFLTAAGVAFCMAGCSSGTSSRFDYPVFGLADNTSTAGSADPSTTSSIPVPPESVYSPGGSYQGQVSRATLPPPTYSPRPSSYSPAPPPDRTRIRSANYSGGLAPNARKAPWTDAKPIAGLHVKVAKGETLSMLSRRYGVPVETIMGANNLSDARLHPGQELVIPGAKAQAAAAAEPAKPAPHVAANEPEPSVAGQPQVRKVKTTTITAPGASSSQGTSLAEEEQNQANPAKAKPAPEQKAKPAAGQVAASPEITGEGSSRIASNDQLPTPDPMSGNSFRWPVRGRVVSEFGAKPDGGHNDGIDLAVPQGTPVQAAENGVVAYAGNELKGYGNLVLIRHANNWVSAYAHNEEILVKRGDKVRRGQVIAKAGATGSVSQPEVHFELRKGSRPVDPTKYMSSEAANAD